MRLWRVADGELLDEYDEELSGGVPSIRMRPDGGAFAYGRGDGNVLAAAYEEEPASVGDIVPATNSVVLQSPVPNPLLTASKIRFRLSRDGPVLLTVHDLGGRRVASLAENIFSIGDHQVAWDGRDRHGHPVSPGVYFIRLTANGEKSIRRVVVAH
jgi:hypothetical protein